MNKTVQNIKNRGGFTLIRTSLRKNLVNAKGFTLIELLIVIAVIGVLAAIVLLAIDPLQQLARGRDASRQTTLSQLGRASQAYATTHDGDFQVPIDDADDFVQILIDAGEIQQAPENPAYSAASNGAACVGGAANSGTNVNNYCYGVNTGTNHALIWVAMESDSLREQGSSSGSVTCMTLDDTDEVYFVWDSSTGSAGFQCYDTAGAQPTP